MDELSLYDSYFIFVKVEIKEDLFRVVVRFIEMLAQ